MSIIIVMVVTLAYQFVLLQCFIPNSSHQPRLSPAQFRLDSATKCLKTLFISMQLIKLCIFTLHVHMNDNV